MRVGIGVRVSVRARVCASMHACVRVCVSLRGCLFLACRSRQASIVLERYLRFEVSLLSFYACERDGPI